MRTGTSGNRSVTRSAGIVVLKEFQFHREEDDTNHDRVTRCHFPWRDPHRKTETHNIKIFLLDPDRPGNNLIMQCVLCQQQTDGGIGT